MTGHWESVSAGNRQGVSAHRVVPWLNSVGPVLRGVACRPYDQPPQRIPPPCLSALSRDGD